MSLFSFFAPYPFLLSFFFFFYSPFNLSLSSQLYVFHYVRYVNFYLVFIFRDFSYMSISLLFDKLSGKLQVKLQFVSDYNNVYGYSLVVFCLFFINSWFHSWTSFSFGFLLLFQSFPSCNIIVFFIHILYNKFYNKF